MKTLYFGFALDKENKRLMACAVSDSHSDAIDKTAEIGGNLLQKVIPSNTLPPDLLHWLTSNGVPREAARDMMMQIADHLDNPCCESEDCNHGEEEGQAREPDGQDRGSAVDGRDGVLPTPETDQ